MTTPATHTIDDGRSNLAVLKIELERRGNSEYHRKRVNADSFTFAQLHALLQSLVAGPENARLATVITYLDGDCDEIQVKDDTDLREAFLVKDEKKSDTLRLSVKLVEPGTRTPDTAGSRFPPRCHNWRSKRAPQHKAQRCQRRPAARGMPSIFSLLFDNDDVFPFPPLQALDRLAAERLECGSSSPAFFKDLLAQPRLVALLRTAADVLDTNNKAGAERSEPHELARKLWLDKNCQYLVQWLKERAPEVSPILTILDGAMKSPQTPARATQAETQHNDLNDGSRDPVDFDTLLAAFSPFCASWRSCGPRPHTVSARASEQNPEPKEDVNLQAAIERSLSNTPAQDGRGTPDHRPKERDENGEAAAVESIAQRPHSPLPVDTSPMTDTSEAAAVERTAQRAPAPRPVETSATDANAETNESRNPAPHKGLHDTEIEQLRSMGFNDDDAIRAALNAAGGNVEYALWRLL